MSRTYHAAAVFLSGFCLVGLAMPAVAAVEVVSVPYPTLDVNSTASLAFKEFDPSLGNLTDIQLKLVSNDEVESLVYNFSKRSGSFTEATATLPVTVTAPGGLSTTMTLVAGPASGSVPAGSLVVAAIKTGAITSETHVQPSDFSLYTGTGLHSFDISVMQGVGTYSGSSGALLYFGGNASSYGTFELTYTYSAVPEPGNVCAGLVALSLGLISVFRRKDSSNLKASPEASSETTCQSGNTDLP